MNNNYGNFFGFKSKPFPSDIDAADILKTDQVAATCNRFNYAVDLGAVAVITGEIGSGKTTALRYAVAKLHPSAYKIFYITATTGSILELFRLFLNELGIDTASHSRAAMIKRIQTEILEISRSKKIKTVVVIDEASLLRLEVFSELHTLCQFDMDTKPILPIILVGQSNLTDKLLYPGSQQLASRVVGRGHLEGSDRKAMEQYLAHHLDLAGVQAGLFDESAITAIHQGSGGLFRKANHLARGALIAAARKKTTQVNADHVRLASTEIF